MELGPQARSGRCGATPSVRLKPAVVHVMANLTASKTGQGGRTAHGRTRLKEAVVNFSLGLQNLFIIMVGEKGQKISFKLIFRLVQALAYFLQCD